LTNQKENQHSKKPSQRRHNLLRRLLIAAALFFLGSTVASAQGIRMGDNFPITSSLVTPGQVSTVTNAIINICTFPANAVPCTNKATTYTSVTLGTPCSTSTQIVLAGTSSCIATTDGRGNWGAWVAVGNYDFTVTVSTGQTFGPFTISAGAVGSVSNVGNNTFTGLNTFTQLITANGGITSAGPNTLNGGGTLAGTFNAQSLKGDNAIRRVCNSSATSAGWAGADVSVWIANAIADLVSNSSGKGTVDARDCTGSQTISQEIDVGNNATTTQVVLLLPNAATWNITITDGVSCGIKQFSQTSIVGNNMVTGNGTLNITGAATASLDSFYCTDPSPVGGGSYVRAEGFQLSNPLGNATLATALMNVQKVFDNSVFRGITISNSATTDGLRVYKACCGTSFINITSNSNSTGKRPVFIQADASARNIDISFYSLSADHAGAGFANIEISGGPAAPTDSVNTNINFYGLYTEDLASTANINMKVVDARSVNIYGWTANGNNVGSTGLDISQTGANQVRAIDLHGYKWQSAGGTGINNHITGSTIGATTIYVSRYFYGGFKVGGGTQQAVATTIEDNELDINNSSGALLYQFPTSGTAIFPGNILTVASDFTTAANTSLQAITGLSWLMPQNQAAVASFSCHLMYSQATAAVADQFGIQDVNVNPTNIAAKAQVNTSATAFTAGNLPTLVNNNPTAIVTFTPSAITTVWNADITGLVEQPSAGNATQTIQIMVQTSTAGDAVTVKRGSYCRIY
jgi:hypothetical protein